MAEVQSLFFMVLVVQSIATYFLSKMGLRLLGNQESGMLFGIGISLMLSTFLYYATTEYGIVIQ